MATVKITPVVQPQPVNQQSPAIANETGVTIPMHSAVALNSSGNLVPALASDSTANNVVGFTETDITANSSAKVAVSGLTRYYLDGTALNLSSGDIMYLSAITPGHVTNVAPSGAAIVVGKAVGVFIAIDIGIKPETKATLETEPMSNNTGAEIPQYAAVYVTSASTIAVANASSEDTMGVIGFTTTNIPAGSTGTVRVGGTTGYLINSNDAPPNSGDALFLSATESGRLTTVPPTNPGDHIIPVGRVAGAEVVIRIVRGIELS